MLSNFVINFLKLFLFDFNSSETEFIIIFSFLLSVVLFLPGKHKLININLQHTFSLHVSISQLMNCSIFPTKSI